MVAIDAQFVQQCLEVEGVCRLLGGYDFINGLWAEFSGKPGKVFLNKPFAFFAGK